jgi:SAM-dependent methyltransferase
VRWNPIAKGLLSSIPGLRRLLRRGTGSPVSARYCYSVWLRHLVRAHESGLPTDPSSVAEFGPGDTLGVGLAALLTGADRYAGLDIVRHRRSERDLRVLDELLGLFVARAPIPDELELPRVNPRLDDYSFPGHILDEARLARTMAPERVESIRHALRGEAGGSGILIEYHVPWHEAALESGVDMVWSQAVMQHVDDPEMAYDAMLRCLVPGGFVSHAINLGSHNVTPEWDGHWRYSDTVWRIIRGRRPYLISRLPLSAHLQMLEARFQIRTLIPWTRQPETPREALAARFRGLSEEDRSTSSVFVQAQKSPDASA